MTSFDYFSAPVRQLCASCLKKLAQSIKSMTYAILRQLRQFVFAPVVFCYRFIQSKQRLIKSAPVRQLPYIYKYITGALTCAEFIYIYCSAARRSRSRSRISQLVLRRLGFMRSARRAE